jgi:hypothetical protein
MPIMVGNPESRDLLQAAQSRSVTPSQEDRTFAADYQASVNRQTSVISPYLAVGAAVDLADTVSSSVGLTDRQQVNQQFLSAVGSPGLSAWFDENKGAVEVVSGLGGIVASDFLAGKILKPAGFAMQAIRGIPFVKNIATLDRQYESAVRLAGLTQREVAKRGLTGADRFIGGNMTLPYMGNLTVNRSAATSNLFRVAAARGLARNATTEAVMAATLNTNSMLYDDDLSHNIAWGLAGIGLGGAIDSLITSHTLRKLANSEQIRQLNRQAYDVMGLEGQRLHAFEVTDSILKSAGASADELGFMFQGSGGVTDTVTSLAIQAAENSQTRGIGERARTLFGRRQAIATPLESQAQDYMQKVTVRGLRGVSNSGFNMSSEGLAPAIRESLVRDPASMLGLEEIGTLPAGMSYEQTLATRQRSIKKRFDRVQEILNDGGVWKRRKNRDGTFTDSLIPLTAEESEALKFESRELLHTNSRVAMVMMEPGEWAPFSHAKLLDSYEPRKVLTEGGLGKEGKAVWSIERSENFKTRLGIDSDGTIFLPDGKSRLSQLDTHEMIHMYHVGQAMVNHFQKAGGTFVVPAKPNWFQLDIAEQILKATDNPASVQFPKSMTRETALVESFAQKVDAIQRARMAKQMAKVPADIDDAFAAKLFYNLPRIDSYTASVMQTSESPIDLLLAGFKSGNDVRKMNHLDLLKSLNDAKKIQGFTEETADTLKDLQGNSFNFLLDRDGKAIQPIIGMRRPMAPFEWSRDDLFTRQAMRQATLRDSLLGATADNYTKELVSRLVADPSFGAARKVQELADDQIRSMVPGFRDSAPQTTRGALMNAVTSRQRRDVDNLTMLAGSRQQEIKTRLTQTLVKEIFERNMGDAITRITGARQARSLMLLNQFLSHRQGWQLEEKLADVTLPSGEKAKAFVLAADSELNRKRFQETFGRPLEKGQQLLSPNGNSIVLDELAGEVLGRMQNVHLETLAAKNTALRAMGLPEIKPQAWYAPPPSLKGKYVGYTFDMERNVVPGMTIIADSPDELSELAAELVKSPQWKDGYQFNTKDEISSFMTLWDKAQMDYIAPNTTAIQPLKRNFGRTGSNEINEHAFADALVTMRDSLISHGDDMIDILHDDVLKAAKTRAHIAKVESAVGTRTTQHSSIYDRFIENLTGKSALSAKDSFFGAPYTWLEDRLNGLLKSQKKDSNSVFKAYSDWLRAAIPGKSPKGTQFDQFAQELGKYMPYRSAMEMAERQSKSKTPADVAEISQKLSWFEAGSRLRWAETMHAVVNLGSIVANMPAVIRALQPRAGESVAEAAARNSSLAMAMNLPDGRSIVMPSGPKLAWSSYRDSLKNPKEAKEFVDKATRLGYMDQEVAEFQRAWGAIDSKAGWRKFMFGDASHEGKGVKDKFIRSGGIDKWLGLISDKSEAFSRQWGMMAGRRVALSMGIEDVDAQISLAHELTNKMIANYDPRNRPEIFQGALGAPIGLFQSYVFNFYERLFRYAETGDYRAIATQFAMQSAVFGTSSLPGWSALNWAFFDRGQGEGEDPVESLYKRFGSSPDNIGMAGGDLLMHGVLANLPKLFGEDGVSLYTRADVQARLPGTEWKTADLGFAQVPMPNIPVVDTLTRLGSGLAQAISAFGATDQTVGLNHLAEIASNTITNRPLAGLIEVFGAGGYDTSRDGQVVSQAKSDMEKVYRVLGVRSMSQQKSIDQFYLNKAAQQEQAARKDVLRGLTRSAIRAGEYDKLPSFFAQYVQEGGDPRYYTRWVKESFNSALDSRSERQLEKVLKDPTNQSNALIGRLLDSQIDVSEDEQATEDYGREAEMNRLIQQGWETTPEPELPEY